MAVLSVFFEKKGLGPLEVNMFLEISITVIDELRRLKWLL